MPSEEAALLTDLTPAPVRSRMAVPDTALLALLGSRDESLRTAEELLAADVHVRGNEITLSGRPADVAFAERVFGELISLAQRGQHVGRTLSVAPWRCCRTRATSRGSGSLPPRC